MAHVTVPDEPTRVSYVVTSADDGPFSFAFSYFSADDISVYDGNDLVAPADYVLTPAATETGGYEGGSITLDTPVSNTTITILRAVPIARETDFPTSGPFSITSLNTWLDKTYAILQQLFSSAQRTLRLADSSPVETATLTIPVAASRANKALVFDASGNATVSVDDYDDQAADAATSAAAAAQSATDATTNGAAQVTLAAAQVALATTQAGNASTSASAASASESAAALSALAAAASASGMKWRPSVRVATTANITLSGAQTIDGVSVIAADRVLVKNQSASADNGIYVCAAGAWSRATDADTWSELVSQVVIVEEGSTQADQLIVCTVNSSGTLGVTSVTWSALVFSISDGSVTNEKLSTISTARFKGRITGSTGAVEDLTGTQATTLLDAVVGDSGSGGTKGLVPAPASGDAAANKFLKASGAWAVPGGVTKFTSSDQTITSAGSLTLAHGLGAVPFGVQVELVCQTGEAGYTAGDVVVVNPHEQDPAGASNRGVSIVLDATNLNIRYGSAAGAFGALNKTTGAGGTLTNGNWKARFKAWV